VGNPFCFLKYTIAGARAAEIRECYKEIGLGEYEKEIVKHLSVLEICNFITPVSHGKKIKYFVPKIASLPIKIAFKADTENRDRDTLRWIREISALIAEHEPTRMRIFQEHQHAT